MGSDEILADVAQFYWYIIVSCVLYCVCSDVFLCSSNRGFNRPGASTNTSIASRASLAKERQILSRLTATTVALTTTETAVPHDLRVSLVSNTSSNTTSGESFLPKTADVRSNTALLGLLFIGFIAQESAVKRWPSVLTKAKTIE